MASWVEGAHMVEGGRGTWSVSRGSGQVLLKKGDKVGRSGERGYDKPSLQRWQSGWF
jgi:hypothetical protein